MTEKPWEELRIIRGLKLLQTRKLSEMTGISESHLSNLEAGRRNPTAEVVAKIAAALDVPVNMLNRTPDEAMS